MLMSEPVSKERLLIRLDAATKVREQLEHLLGGFERIQWMPPSHPDRVMWAMSCIAEDAIEEVLELREKVRSLIRSSN